MADESLEKQPETNSNVVFKKEDRMKLGILGGFRTFILQVTQQILTVILTIIYSFRLSTNPSVAAPVTPPTSMLTRRVYLDVPNSTPASSSKPTLPQAIPEISPEVSPPQPPKPLEMPTATISGTSYPGGIKAYYQAKIEAAELTINERTQNLRRLEAQRNALNARGASCCPSISMQNSN